MKTLIEVDQKKNTAQEITLKEIWERVFKLEVLMGELNSFNKRQTFKFTVFTWVIIILQIINILVHTYFSWQKIL